MDSSINNIKSFNNESLVKFIEKIGHHEAAKIIQEKGLDGQKILDLTETETVEWKLTNSQKNVLSNCISQIKSNPLSYLDAGQQKQLHKILNIKKARSNSKEGRPMANLRKKYTKLEDTFPSNEDFTVYGNNSGQVNNRQPHPLPRNEEKYFKLRQFKKQELVDVVNRISLGIKSLSESNIRDLLNSNQNLENNSNSNKHTRFDIHKNDSRDYFSCSSINENEFDFPRGHYYTESEYIYASCLEGIKDNTTVNRIKKYVKWSPRKFSSDNGNLFKSTHGVYLELHNLEDFRNIPHNSKQITETHIYEEPPINTENPQLPKDKTKKNATVYFTFDICASCYVGCSVIIIITIVLYLALC